MNRACRHFSRPICRGLSRGLSRIKVASDRFSVVVLLSAPLEVLIERVSVRTNNTYGSSEADQFAIRQYVLDVEPLLRIGATLELDGRRPVPELADEVERLIAASDQI